MPEAGEAARQFLIARERGGMMKDRKMPKKKKPARKIALRAVRLQEVKFTTNSKTGNYPTIPISPVD
ncbi:MAG TPA: hypothetical protein VKB40_00410 [Candidatus Acidoferrales bacterium]|jgi:hypothetical protein|nr:hypothetical protein [Candidatus Acidoferrales bacterium]